MKKLIIIVGCVLYIVCPIDLLPDLIPLLGWLDDGGALALAVTTMLNTTERKGTA